MTHNTAHIRCIGSCQLPHQPFDSSEFVGQLSGGLWPRQLRLIVFETKIKGLGESDFSLEELANPRVSVFQQSGEFIDRNRRGALGLKCQKLCLHLVGIADQRLQAVGFRLGAFGSRIGIQALHLFEGILLGFHFGNLLVKSLLKFHPQGDDDSCENHRNDDQTAEEFVFFEPVHDW